ncbi:MAG: TetR/AcrR family transcriptional regulator [Cyclobacteriaceae bacterium]|jgi:AcrR family transcriptional regulator|nr:TetR/AcrR family transcriptional regulator [Cyclobacteriaceae bacterium]
MSWQIQIQLNEKLYLRDPSVSDLGRRIIQQGAVMIEKIGLEEFTFKKLASELNTNESSIYRYFENKHRLLLYLVNWYWRWMEYQIMVQTSSLDHVEQKIEITLRILLHQQNTDLFGGPTLDRNVLRSLIIKESAKSYLTNHVTEDNQQLLFKPYKDLCARMAGIFSQLNNEYRYCRSLASTVLEMTHQQHFFMHHLPSLTDFGKEKDETEIFHFLQSLILGTLYHNMADNGILRQQK